MKCLKENRPMGKIFNEQITQEINYPKDEKNVKLPKKKSQKNKFPKLFLEPHFDPLKATKAKKIPKYQNIKDNFVFFT